MASGAYSWQPRKSPSLSAFFPEPKDKLVWGIGHLQRQTALATEERGLSEEPASPARVPSLKLPGDGHSHCCRLAKLPHLTFSFIS